MQQVKLFVGIEAQRGEFESEINAWLKSSGAQVIQMTANVAPQTPKGGATGGALGKTFGASDLFVCMLYESA